mmetsp:Transcript_28510/g.66934  ORF Transcript_28510/g.66934 Transcript_28510/m.66934 type:complete len:101 (-) Transcript_28510:596-898(-)
MLDFDVERRDHHIVVLRLLDQAEVFVRSMGSKNHQSVYLTQDTRVALRSRSSELQMVTFPVWTYRCAFLLASLQQYLNLVVLLFQALWKLNCKQLGPSFV